MRHGRHARAPLAVLAVLACGCARGEAAAAAEGRRFELADVAKIVRLSDVQIGPDGKWSWSTWRAGRSAS